MQIFFFTPSSLVSKPPVGIFASSIDECNSLLFHCDILQLLLLHWIINQLKELCNRVHFVQYLDRKNVRRRFIGRIKINLSSFIAAYWCPRWVGIEKLPKQHIVTDFKEWWVIVGYEWRWNVSRQWSDVIYLAKCAASEEEKKNMREVKSNLKSETFKNSINLKNLFFLDSPYVDSTVPFCLTIFPSSFWLIFLSSQPRTKLFIKARRKTMKLIHTLMLDIFMNHFHS